MAMTNNNDSRTQSNLTVNSRSTYNRRLYIHCSSCSTLEKNILVLKYSAISRTSQFVKKFTSYLFNLLQSSWSNINGMMFFSLFFAAIRLSYWPVSGPAADLASRNVKLNSVRRRIILAFWLALTYDLLEDRWINDVIDISFSFFFVT